MTSPSFHSGLVLAVPFCCKVTACKVIVTGDAYPHRVCLSAMPQSNELGPHVVQGNANVMQLKNTPLFPCWFGAVWCPAAARLACKVSVTSDAYHHRVGLCLSAMHQSNELGPHVNVMQLINTPVFPCWLGISSALLL